MLTRARCGNDSGNKRAILGTAESTAAKFFHGGTGAAGLWDVLSLAVEIGDGCGQAAGDGRFQRWAFTAGSLQAWAKRRGDEEEDDLDEEEDELDEDDDLDDEDDDFDDDESDDDFDDDLDDDDDDDEDTFYDEDEET